MKSNTANLLLAVAAATLASSVDNVQAAPRPRIRGELVHRQVANSTAHPNDATGYKGAAAYEVGQCSDIAVDILKQGGNAADGMIAGALCVGTIAAYHSGIGGGGFMIVRYNNQDGSHGYEEIDFRETMPAGGNVTMYSQFGAKQTVSTIGGLAVGVPGEMRAWQKLHQRHGSLPWKTLFQPAINLARNGYPVTVDLAAAIKGYNFTQTDPLFAETYAPNGTALQEGDIAYRKRYADTLERIANEGADIFYASNSSIAQNIISTIHNNSYRPGIMTLEDLANYTAIVREPLNITYRNQRIFSTIAPSSGTVVLSALKIFEGYNGSAQDTDPAINLTTHRLLEATQFAYGQRTQFGDPAFTPNVTALEKEFIQYGTAAQIRTMINDSTTYPIGYYDPEHYETPPEAGTSHMAVADGNGMAISLTTTVNLYWGARIMTEDGIILNDEMDDFSSPGQTNSFGFAASPINYIAPGKRPQSSIASSIAEDLDTGVFTMATGSAGGSRIITATLQELYHHIDQGLNASQCVHHSRWHDQLSGVTYLEWAAPQVGIAGYSNETAAYLKDIGYNITYQDTSGSTSHVIIRFRDGMLEAASDPRKAAGYGAAY